MSVETHDRLEFERYLEYQRLRRPQRIETLGGAATALMLSTFDMGVSEVRDPASSEVHVTSQAPDSERTAEVVQLRTLRQRRLADFATDSAELGYAHAA